MSDETTKSVIPDIEPLAVVRNGTTINYVSAEIKRGERAGEKYLAPDPTLTLEQVIQHVGASDVLNIVMAKWTILAQRWTMEASTMLNERGEPVSKPLDREEYSKYATEFSARGMTSAQLDEAIKLVTDELSSLVLDLEFNLKTKEERMQIAQEKINRIKSLQADKASRKRPRKEEEDKTSE